MYYQDTGALSDRWLFTTPKVLRRRENMEMAPKRRRSERGPISLAVRALLELGENVDFPKYFEKYDSLVRKEKFPEIYHTCVDANDTDA